MIYNQAHAQGHVAESSMMLFSMRHVFLLLTIFLAMRNCLVVVGEKKLAKTKRLLLILKFSFFYRSVLASFCKLPREMGPCRDAKERYYYDTAKNRCKFFTYGGCRGNQNNFRTFKKCQKACQI